VCVCTTEFEIFEKVGINVLRNVGILPQHYGVTTQKTSTQVHALVDNEAVFVQEVINKSQYETQTNKS